MTFCFNQFPSGVGAKVHLKGKVNDNEERRREIEKAVGDGNGH